MCELQQTSDKEYRDPETIVNPIWVEVKNYIVKTTETTETNKRQTNKDVIDKDKKRRATTRDRKQRQTCLRIDRDYCY